jgi:hypothetical protein
VLTDYWLPQLPQLPGLAQRIFQWRGCSRTAATWQPEPSLCSFLPQIDDPVGVVVAEGDVLVRLLCLLAQFRARWSDPRPGFYDGPWPESRTVNQLHERSEVLKWLETALRLRDPGLELLKTDPFLDPLRKAPRFQAIERELKFPD